MWGSGKGNSTTESDQRRMLLLPQEVKELGDGKEIIIYEGIRPILAEKIIYYQDKNFKNRLLPPPKVKRITPVSGRQTASSHEDTRLEGQDNIIYRPMIRADIENIDNLPLTDFSLDLEYIIPQTGQPLDGEGIKAAAQRYLNQHIES